MGTHQCKFLKLIVGKIVRCTANTVRDNGEIKAYK